MSILLTEANIKVDNAARFSYNIYKAIKKEEGLINSMNHYSIKMRSSKMQGNESCHISGAEKIVQENQLNDCAAALIKRGMYHEKGEADSLNLKIEKIKEENVLYLDALQVTTVTVEDFHAGIQQIRLFLQELNITKTEEILDILKKTYSMRGAMLLDVNTLERLEPDYKRGIRATYMDQEKGGNRLFSSEKNHYAEAIVLATKVVNCPGILGEICISDDPAYVTGYVASKQTGYRRITKMKEYGSKNGGRIFLYNGDKANVGKTIEFLQKQMVIVRNVKSIEPLTRESKWLRLQKALAAMKEQNLYRSMKKITSAQKSHVMMQERELLMLASNNYLGLSTHERVISYTEKILKLYGCGSGGSRLTTGNTDLHEQLEKTIAEFKKTEAAICFNTGYVANLATIASLVGKNDIVFSDKLNHASIIDGCRLSGARIVVYEHNDMQDLERKILENPCARGLIVSDAVFSMDGDILKLPEFLALADKYELLSMVDEAHSTGVIGETGRGISEYYHTEQKPDIIMGTLSKAVGSEGGFVAGNQLLIDYLRNKARGFIFSTSLSPVSIGASIAAFQLMLEEPCHVQRLQNNIRCFCKALQKYGIMQQSDTAIIPIVIGDEKKAMDISEELFRQGVFISAIRYPTVEKGKARLRAALMATHTEQELEKAAKLIASLVESQK